MIFCYKQAHPHIEAMPHFLTNTCAILVFPSILALIPNIQVCIVHCRILWYIWYIMIQNTINTISTLLPVPIGLSVFSMQLGVFRIYIESIFIIICLQAWICVLFGVEGLPSQRTHKSNLGMINIYKDLMSNVTTMNGAIHLRLEVMFYT